MKRLIVAAATMGVISLALVGISGTAGASTAHQAASARTATTAAVVTVTQNANLKGGDSVTVAGSGFPDKATLVVAECNADGDGPGALGGSCDTGKLGSVKTSSTGTFSTKFTVIQGDMSTHVDTSCPQGLVQVQHSVECIIGVADLSSDPVIFAYAAIHFTAPALKLTYTKSTVVNSVQTYSVKISETGDYAPNVGGFDVLGRVSPTNNSEACQGSSNDSTVWTGEGAPGLPACTVHLGEVIEVKFGGKKVGLERATVSGAFTWTIAHAIAGKTYSVEALGLTSSEELTASAVTP
jgi:hypothetical protein